MIDRILEVGPGEYAVAIVNVPNTLTVFDTHFPRFPVLPGVLLLDAMGEVARLVARVGRQRAVHGARFRHYVRPGDQVRITVHATDHGAFVAVAEVDGRKVATVRSLRFELEDPS
jgi:3-hydroxymyristoyl/3-hydroxydecanoyl-(acyl carrier protein) dehydratase